MTSASATLSVPDVGIAAALAHVSGTAKKARTVSDEFRLDGRVGLVSGGNRGLGLESALVLAELGAKVWVLDLAASPSEEFQACAIYAKYLHQEIGSKSNAGENENQDRLIYRKVDVTDPISVQKVCQEIVATDKRLDVCVAAAGILPADKSCIDVTTEEFERVIKVNLTGVFNIATKVAAEMIGASLPGSIILIASMSGSLTNKDHPWIGYNTSKAGVLQMARSMACELGHSGIRVNTLSPGHIRTSMTASCLETNPGLEEKWSSLNPLGRIGSPHEIRGVISWLASDASSFCTGSDIIVSGGHHSW